MASPRVEGKSESRSPCVLPGVSLQGSALREAASGFGTLVAGSVWPQTLQHRAQAARASSATLLRSS
jgi:hypothetical protein